MSTCLFCLRHTDNIVGQTCTYHLPHSEEVEVKPKQVVKVDVQLCLKCKLHPKNPLSMASSCLHEYSVAEVFHTLAQEAIKLTERKEALEELVEAPSIPIRDEKQEASTPPFDVVEPHCRKCGGNKLEAPKRHCSGGNGQDKPFIFLDLYKCKDCQMESTL